MSYPADPEFQAIDVKLEHNSVRSETRSGRTQVRNVGSARWSFTAKYNDLTRDEFAPVFAFLASKQGGASSFSITPPVISNSRGNPSGTVTVSGAHAAGSTEITITGLTGTIKAGDFVTFSNHTKVYMVTEDRAGEGAMKIEPPLMESLANGRSVTYNSVPFTMRVSRDVQQVKFTGYERYQFEVDMIEAI